MDKDLTEEKERQAELIKGEPQADPEIKEEAAPIEHSDRSSEELIRLENDLEIIREEAKKYYDQYLRALAEADNMKKRAARERDEYIKFATVPLIKRLLSILDDLERALTMSNQNQDYSALSKGVEMITKNLQEILQSEGIKEIQATGNAFDPQLHEPLVVEKSEVYPENTVVEELQKGYTLHGRVIRPSLVKVSS